MPCRGLFNYNYKCSSSHATTVKELIFSEIVMSKSQSHNYCPKSNGHDHLDPGENMIQQSNITSKKSVFLKVWPIEGLPNASLEICKSEVLIKVSLTRFIYPLKSLKYLHFAANLPNLLIEMLN